MEPVKACSRNEAWTPTLPQASRLTVECCLMYVEEFLFHGCQQNIPDERWGNREMKVGGQEKRIHLDRTCFLGMSGLDSGRFPSFRGYYISAPIVPKFLIMCYRKKGVDAAPSWPHTESLSLLCTNQTKCTQCGEHHFTIGDENPHGRRLLSPFPVPFCVYV